MIPTPRTHSLFVTLAAVALFVAHLTAAPASAQAPSVSADPSFATEACRSVAPTREVDVSTEGGRTIRGTLTCLSSSHVSLLKDGVMTDVSLRRIRRIRTPADPAWDGGAVGAAVPMILWAVFCRSCSAEPFLNASLAYGMVGLVADSIVTNRETIYQRRAPALSVGWGFEF